ncbi:MAG: alpha-methylacyl-CoA racemase, partial [Ilumatobacteraceae bacterium]
PLLKQRIADLFATKTRDEWCELMEGSDVCFAPVLTMTEAAQHRHNVERGTFVEIAGTVQPAPAPRLSRTPGEITMPPAHPGQHSAEILRDWGFDAARIDTLIASGAVVAG